MNKSTITQLFWIILSTIIGIVGLPIMFLKELIECIYVTKHFNWFRFIIQAIMCGIGGLFHWCIIEQFFTNYPIWILF